jgi:hypothetical protein
VRKLDWVPRELCGSSSVPHPTSMRCGYGQGRSSGPERKARSRARVVEGVLSRLVDGNRTLAVGRDGWGVGRDKAGHAGHGD